jgi:hypothetical protein
VWGADYDANIAQLEFDGDFDLDYALTVGADNSEWLSRTDSVADGTHPLPSLPDVNKNGYAQPPQQIDHGVSPRHVHVHSVEQSPHRHLLNNADGIMRHSLEMSSGESLFRCVECLNLLETCFISPAPP